MMWIDWLVIGLFIAEFVVILPKIGKYRKPLTGQAVALIGVTSTTIIVVILNTHGAI